MTQDRGGQSDQLGVAVTCKNKEGAYWRHTERGRSLGAPKRNLLITTFSTLVILLRMSYRAIKAAKRVWGLAPRTVFTITFPTMPANSPLQIIMGMPLKVYIIRGRSLFMPQVGTEEQGLFG